MRALKVLCGLPWALAFVGVLQGNGTNRIYLCRCTHTEREERERFIFKNWFMQLWGLTSLKSAGLAAA